MSEETEIQQTPAADHAETAPEGQQGAENHQEEHRFPKHVPIGEHVKTRQERNRYRDEANTLRAKLEVYERGGVQPQGQQQAQEPAKLELPKRPSMDTFKMRDEYERAVDEWAVQVAEAKAEAKANERIEAKFRERDEMSQRGQAEQALAKIVESFTAKTAAAAATVPDINDRVAYLNDPEIVAAVAPQIWQDIMDSDAAADLMNRPEKSSMDVSRSTSVNPRSTPYIVSTWRSTLPSSGVANDAVRPVRTLTICGRLTEIFVPPFETSPFCSPNLLSYWRSTRRANLDAERNSFWNSLRMMEEVRRAIVFFSYLMPDRRAASYSSMLPVRAISASDFCTGVGPLTVLVGAMLGFCGAAGALPASPLGTFP